MADLITIVSDSDKVAPVCVYMQLQLQHLLVLLGVQYAGLWLFRRLVIICFGTQHSAWGICVV